jgi:hypothetical protein
MIAYLICLVGMQAKSNDYVFVKSDATPAAMCFLYNTYRYIMEGVIDGSGTFICEKTRKTKLFRSPNDPIPESLKDGKEIPYVRTLRHEKIVFENYINRPQFDVESVYEYRSGKLIPGFLTKNWRFSPEGGEKIIDFSEYQYGPGAIRIYNLPGKFVKRSDYESEKAKLRKDADKDGKRNK